MSLKLLLVSVDGALVHNGTIHRTISESLGKLARELVGHGVRTVLWTNKDWQVNGEPLQSWFSRIAGVDVIVHGMRVDGSPPRRQGNSAQPILDRYHIQSHEAILVGGMEEDKIAGVNNQLLLLRPDWYAHNMDYGFAANTVSDLARFCFIFALRQHPVFWRVNDRMLDISAAGPFSTMNQNYAVFGGDARAFAKHGGGHPDFWFYFTVSSLYFSGMLNGVNYICSYPGHSPDSDPDEHGVASTLVKLGKCFHKNYYHDLITRHTLARRSHSMRAAVRTFSAQFNTIVLKRRPHRNLAQAPNKTNLSLIGKTVLVVDDFVTSGRSSESARSFIEAAGGQAKLYSWLKTINTSYERIVSPIDFDPYSPVELRGEPQTLSYPYDGSIVAPAAPAEIQDMFDRYVAWNWQAP